MVQSYPRRRARYFSRSLQFHLARQVAVGKIYNFAPIARLMAMSRVFRLVRFCSTRIVGFFCRGREMAQGVARSGFTPWTARLADGSGGLFKFSVMALPSEW